METADDYLVDWHSHSGSKAEGGCLTHASEVGERRSRSICGVFLGGDGLWQTVQEAGGVGCLRCNKILKSRGVLPLEIT